MDNRVRTRRMNARVPRIRLDIFHLTNMQGYRCTIYLHSRNSLNPRGASSDLFRIRAFPISTNVLFIARSFAGHDFFASKFALNEV